MHGCRWWAGALLLVALLASGCGKKPDASSAANTFLEQVKNGQFEAAYAEASFAFQTRQTLAAFEANATEIGLPGLRSVEVGAPAMEDELVKMEVQVTNRLGATFPLIVTMQEQRGAWRIYSLKFPRSPETGLAENRFSIVGKGASFGGGTAQPPPDESAVRKLLAETMGDFDRAIKDQSFDEFHSKVSATWKQQLTSKTLQRAFQPFIDKGVDMSGFADVVPVFDAPPYTSGEGLLLVSGHYPTEPYKILFSMKYIYELPEWKLFGIDVNLQK